MNIVFPKLLNWDSFVKPIGPIWMVLFFSKLTTFSFKLHIPGFMPIFRLLTLQFKPPQRARAKVSSTVESTEPLGTQTPQSTPHNHPPYSPDVSTRLANQNFQFNASIPNEMEAC